MADQAYASGVALPFESSWDSFTNGSGEKVEGGSKIRFHLYDPAERRLLGPFDVKKDLRSAFEELAPLTRLDVRYQIYGGNGKKIQRVCDNFETVK